MFISTVFFLSFMVECAPWGAFDMAKQKLFSLIKNFGRGNVAASTESNALEPILDNTPPLDSLKNLLDKSAQISFSPMKTDPRWFAAECGKQIELGDTGFYIRIQPVTIKHAPTYIGYTPEHRPTCGAHHLLAVKEVIEGLATEREQFIPKKSAQITPPSA